MDLEQLIKALSALGNSAEVQDLQGGENLLEEVNATRMDRLGRLAQVVSSNLEEREALSEDLALIGKNVAAEAQQLQTMCAQIDRQLALLRAIALRRCGAEEHLQRLQENLPALLDGALNMCQVHNIGDLEMWLRGDGVVKEVCEAVGCELIDPEEGEEFDCKAMQEEQSEFTADEDLAGRVCSCLMPGVQVRRMREEGAEVVRPAQVVTYRLE